MTNEGTTRASWWNRNLWPLVVGAVALVALLGWTLVAIDRFSDDGGQVDERVEGRSSGDDPGGSPFSGGAFEANRVLLGVTFAEFDELVVAEVTPGMPADEAGVRRGDEIREVDGERVRDVDELRAAIAGVEAGERYELTIERGGDDLTLDVRRPELHTVQGPNGRQVVPGSSSPFGGPRFDGRQPGAGALPVPDAFEALRLRPTLGVSVVQTNEGLQVMAALPGSAAVEAGMREGDVITKVGRDRVETINELRAALPVFDLSGGEPPDEIGDVVEITVLRDGRELELDVVFSIRPGDLMPVEPPRTSTPQIPEELLEELVDRLESMERRLSSDEFLEGLVERLLEELGTLISPPGEAAGGADVPQAEFDLGAALAGLDVFSGSVSAVSADSITLSGARGAISFAMTDETVFLGASPRVGGVAAVAVDADGVVVLVVVAG